MTLPEEEYADQSRLVYIDLMTDTKYLYPDPADSISSESLQKFLADVKSNKYHAIGTKQFE